MSDQQTEFECRNDGLRIYRPTDYPLLPDCPACGNLVKPTSRRRRLLRRILDLLA